MGLVYLVIIAFIIFHYLHKQIFTGIQNIIRFIMKRDYIVNGYEAVDLGLSVKWASRNVDAVTPEDFGKYFAWGEVSPKDKYGFENYTYYDSEKKKYIFIGNDISGSKYDVARQRLGGSWRMPKVEEFYELIKKCVWRWEAVKGVVGYKVTGPNGNSIFLPAAYNSYGVDRDSPVGFYWTGTLVDEDYAYAAFCLNFYDNNEYFVNEGNPIDGQTVRAVTEE